MAWVSPKVYAILSKSEEGKDIIERLPDLTQEEASKEIDDFFGSENGEYNQAKMDDEAEENAYKAVSDEEISEKDYEETEQEKREREYKKSLGLGDDSKSFKDVIQGTPNEDIVTDDEISEALADFQWQITDDTTVGQYAQETANKLGCSKEQVLKVIRNENPNIKEDEQMAKIAGLDDEDEMSKNFDQGENHRIWNKELAQRYADGDVSHEESIVIDYLNGDMKSEQFYKEYFKMNREKRKKADELFDKYYPGSPAEKEDNEGK